MPWVASHSSSCAALALGGVRRAQAVLLLLLPAGQDQFQASPAGTEPRHRAVAGPAASAAPGQVHRLPLPRTVLITPLRVSTYLTRALTASATKTPEKLASSARPCSLGEVPVGAFMATRPSPREAQLREEAERWQFPAKLPTVPLA